MTRQQALKVIVIVAIVGIALALDYWFGGAVK